MTSTVLRFNEQGTESSDQYQAVATISQHFTQNETGAANQRLIITDRAAKTH